MSRSWNRRIEIRLFADVAHLELVQSWPQRLLATHQVVLPSPDIAPASALIAAALKALSWKGGITLVIGSRWLRFATLPWELQSGNDQQDATIAAGWLAQSLRVSLEEQGVQPQAGSWQVILDKASFGRARLFAAMSQETYQSLQMIDEPPHPLLCWKPWAAVAWNRHHSRLTSDKGVVGIAEPGSLGLLTYEEGRVCAVSQRHLPPSDMESLLSLLRLEELRTGQRLQMIADTLPSSWQSGLATVSTLLSPCGGPSVSAQPETAAQGVAP